MTQAQTAILLIFYVLLALAAAMDVWKLRISNFFPAAIILLFQGWMYSCGWNASLWQNAVVFFATFFGGLFLFSRGWLGGGDVKLLTAIAMWFDFTGAGALYLFVAMGGALLSLAFIAMRRLLPSAVTQGGSFPGLKPGGPIPYGIAIAGGAALAVVSGYTNPQPPPEPWSLHRLGLSAAVDYIDSAASIMIS